MSESADLAPPLVLVADDDPMTCLLAEETLRQSGFRGYVVHTCRALGESLVQLRPDAVLVSPCLPDGDAFEILAREPAALAPAIVVMLEKGAAAPQVAHLYARGVMDFVVKPVVWDWLGLRLQRALEHKRWQREAARLAAQQRCLARLARSLGEPVSAVCGDRLLAQLLALPWPTLRGAGIFLATAGGLQPLARAGLDLGGGRLETRLLETAVRRLAHEWLASLADLVPPEEAAGRPVHELCAVALRRRGTLHGVLLLAGAPHCRWDAAQTAFLDTVRILLAEWLAGSAGRV